MKIMHMSDLHLGKRIKEFSMLEDQEYILNRILGTMDETNVQTVIIAGDVYDKAVPSAEAVELFDKFLSELLKRNLKVFVISGNHDSPERIAFGNKIMYRSNIFMSPVYMGEIEPVTLEDEFGEINFYMLPFLKPANVRRFYPETEIISYTDALKTVISNMNIDTEKRNILISHQFVTGAVRSDSEEKTVGGLDNVDSIVFKDFDYTALGHIHRAQKCGTDFIRYSGSPLKYSFSEKENKSVTIIDMKTKGETEISFAKLSPKRDMLELKGTYNNLTLKSFYENTSYTEDYVNVTLTDEEEIPDALRKLRVIYKNIMSLRYDNKRTRNNFFAGKKIDITAKTPLEHFDEFYKMQNGQPMSDEQRKIIVENIEKIWRNET